MDTLGKPLKFICSRSSMLQGEMGADGVKGERGEPGMTVSGDPLGPPHSDTRFPGEEQFCISLSSASLF